LLEKDPNWRPESWGEYFMQSFFEVFEVVLSYITNTLSFLRVGAFVLVHAGMMMVFSKLAEMSGGLGYLIFMIMGNVIVIGLEGLLVGIQVLRLEFYEMFIRFFEGQGVAFSPVSIRNNGKI
jgi:V/A-type H+-transporting ATPase subunit I